MFTAYDKAIAGALGPLLAWAVLALLTALFGEPPADVQEGIRVLASLSMTAALVYLVPNKPKRRRR